MRAPPFLGQVTSGRLEDQGFPAYGRMRERAVDLLQTCLFTSPRDAPEACPRTSARRRGATLTRARGMPGAQCTRSLVCAWCSEYAHEYSQRGNRISPAFPHAMVLTVYFALSPAIGSFATVAL